MVALRTYKYIFGDCLTNAAEGGVFWADRALTGKRAKHSFFFLDDKIVALEDQEHEARPLYLWEPTYPDDSDEAYGE